jgi:hypothetical protein
MTTTPSATPYVEALAKHLVHIASLQEQQRGCRGAFENVLHQLQLRSHSPSTYLLLSPSAPSKLRAEKGQRLLSCRMLLKSAGAPTGTKVGSWLFVPAE